MGIFPLTPSLGEVSQEGWYGRTPVSPSKDSGYNSVMNVLLAEEYHHDLYFIKTILAHHP